MPPDFHDHIKTAVNSSREVTDFKPDLALVAGTGLGPMLEDIKVEATLPYPKIKGFPHSTAPSHKGELLFGTLKGRRVVAQSGRFHLYEGWSAQEVVLPVYVLRALGAKPYICTNAERGRAAPRMHALLSRSGQPMP